jgi:hypothetical protein
VSVILTIATTGPIATKADNPALPTQPEEIAAAVSDAYDRRPSPTSTCVTSSSAPPPT